MKTFLTKILQSSYYQIFLQSSRLIVLQSPLLFISLSLNAQILGVRSFGDGQQVFLKYYDGHEIQRAVIPDWKENPVFEWKERDVIHQFDLRYLQGDNQNPSSGNRNELFDWIEPGLPIEGDMPSDCEYSKDGSIFAFIYQLSDKNVIFKIATYLIMLIAIVFTMYYPNWVRSRSRAKEGATEA